MADESELRKHPFLLGIIGLGNIGRIHYDALAKSGQSDFRIQTIADISSMPLLNNIHSSRNYRELLQDPSIQAVSINTPPNTHYQLVMDSLNAGKHVLVEKPPALTVSQCEEMITLANRKNKVLFMAFHARYNPSVEAAKKELKDKMIKQVNIQYAEYVQNYHSPNGWIFNPEIAGGGVLMDSGINALSIATYILPGSTTFSVENVQLDKASGFNVETKAHVSFSFGDDNKGTISMDWLHQGPEVRQVTFATDQDEYTVDIVRNALTKNGEILMSIDQTRDAVDLESEYRQVYQDFAQHLVTGISLTSTKELAFIKEAYKKAGLNYKSRVVDG